MVGTRILASLLARDSSPDSRMRNLFPSRVPKAFLAFLSCLIWGVVCFVLGDGG